jgi:alkylation response protein AidB-like acyl-CoA dehydrogenase
MKAKLTDEQERIQETAEEFLESNDGIELARRRMEGDEEVVDELWSDLAEMDYPAVTVPLDHGGLGEGMVYLCALLEAAGRHAMPGPFPETTAFAVPLVDELGTEAQKERHLEPVAAGDRRLSFAVHDDRTESIPETIQLDGEVQDDGSVVLSGTKTLIPYGGEVDAVLVAARTRDATGFDGITTCVVDPDAEGMTATELDSLDRTRPMYDLELDDVVVDEADVLGPVHGSGSALRRAIDRFNVATTAMLVGAADHAVDNSVEYGNDREQYGQPIGRFQAVKHRIADMWMEMQSARSLVYYAAWTLDADDPDAVRAVSAAKSYAADRLHRVFGDDIWNHGGTGFTWDYDGHIYLKQAKAWRNFLGTPEEHRDRLIEARRS